MLCVLFYHTEVYYTGTTRYYFLYSPFFLNFFFFLTGYFFNRGSELDIRKKFAAIGRTLLWPYIFFTTLIWLPKSFARGTSLAFADFVRDIFGGYASWYVAALIVAEILFSLIVRYIKSSGLILLATGVPSLVIYHCLYALLPDYPWPWYLDEGIKALFYISLGYWYMRNRERFSGCISTVAAAISITVFLAGVFLTRDWNVYTLSPVQFPVAVILSIIGILVILNVSHLMQRVGRFVFLTYVGRNSLVYYFLNGGCILIICKVLEMSGFGFNGNYLPVFAITAVTVCLLTFASWTINRWFPVLLGKKEAVDRLKGALKGRFGNREKSVG